MGTRCDRRKDWKVVFRRILGPTAQDACCAYQGGADFVWGWPETACIDGYVFGRSIEVRSDVREVDLDDLGTIEDVAWRLLVEKKLIAPKPACVRFGGEQNYRRDYQEC